MSRRVLLVDNDVVALGALASALRARGITVYNAGEIFEAVEAAFKHRPDVVLAAKHLDRDGDLAQAFRVVPEIAETPVLYLVRAGDAEELGPNDVHRADVD